MTAFEKILSGIPQMDKALNHIRTGDNIVWQVDSLHTFSFFVKPFVSQAIADGRNLIYIHFSSHETLLEPMEGLKIYTLELSHRFEKFTIELHQIIQKEGENAFYIFDCLSDLQVAWSTDLMMGNFFRVTCPLLFELNTVSYFPLLKGRHSYETVAKIRDTTQVLIDIFSEEDLIYVQPLKVRNRYSPTMFLPHAYTPKNSDFTPLTDGIRVSKFYESLHHTENDAEDALLDSWDRFFANAKQKHANGTLSRRECKFISDVIMTRDGKLRMLIEKYFEAEDLFFVRSRMIGTGMIGGKACGMLLARKIIETELPQYHKHTEPHDSYFIGSDVFYTYLIENKCWKARVRHRTPEEYFTAGEELKEAIENGHFPANIREQFCRLLTYFGQSPVIVRSSSILEDGFGNAFAGKYESVFCPNVGDLESRLKDFENAVKIVYASTMDPAALEYRLRRGMAQRDEQMALLVQRVSGSYYGKYYMPNAAGVGFSYSTYRFMEEMDPTKGMLRLVMGLGTKAVDRTIGDYPRLVSLDMPSALLKSDSAFRHRFSQHKLDVLDLENAEKIELPFEDFMPLLPKNICNCLLSHDYDTERMFRDSGQHRDIYFVSCDGLTNNEKFTKMMEDILSTLQRVYAYPVDIEYAINLGENDDFVVNLLQCRPLQTYNGGETVIFPTKVESKNTLFHLKKATMGSSREISIDVIVYIDPYLYYTYPYHQKPQIAKLVGAINQYYKGKGKQMLLFTPGRIGTSSPELGVPVSFGEINEFAGICEVSYSKAGYMPELSYGSHMFQDLVEANILYAAIFENQHTLLYQPKILENRCDNLFPALFPDYAQLGSMIKIYEPHHLTLYHDFEKEEILCTF